MMMMMVVTKMVVKLWTWYVVTDGGGQKDDGNPESFVLLPRFSKLVSSVFKQVLLLLLANGMTKQRKNYFSSNRCIAANGKTKQRESDFSSLSFLHNCQVLEVVKDFVCWIFVCLYV